MFVSKTWQHCKRSSEQLNCTQFDQLILRKQESCAVAKMTARCAIYIGALNFRDSLTTPTATIPNIFHGLLFRSTL